MGMLKRAIASIALSMLAACSALTTQKSTVDSSAARSFSVPVPAPAGRSLAALNEEEQKVIEQKLQEVLDFCLPRLSGYEKKSADQAEYAFWLSMSGLIAGAVIAPALTAAAAHANAAWIAALSGWAGSTNFAGQVLRSTGLSGTTVATTRNNIIQSVRDEVVIASNRDKPFDERRNALMRARADCILYEIAVPNVPEAK